NNFLIALLILGLCVSVQAQTRRPDLREVCRRQSQRCRSQENRNGRTNEVTNIFNNFCRGSNRNWRNVTRCELTRATCELTLVRCSTLSCANVRRTLSGGDGGGRPTPPGSPTPPTGIPPDPEPTPSIPLPRTPRPRTTRRSRTTTRRTPTTRRSRRTTTRRTPTTRRPRRTTTRRTPTTRRPRRTTTRRTPTTR
ncbi:hypothetical protein KR038_009442, partial [Drosophila bunnanda]